MKMKKLINIVLSAAFPMALTIGSLTSCEELQFGNRFLSQQPDQIGVNIDTVFSKKYYADQVLTKAYSTLHYGIEENILGGDMQESITDLSYSTCHYGGSKLLYYNGAYSAGNEGRNTKYLFTESNTWTGIRYGWLMIENVDRVPDMTQYEKNLAKAEARMIIATHYADMLRHFGGLPWIDHAITVNEEFYYPRQTFEQTVNNIVGLIDAAIPDLQWDVEDADDGRMTQAYAMGLKLRVLLFAASPLFNSAEPYLAGEASSQLMTWYGNYSPDRWQAALDAAEDFIEALNQYGSYSLLQATEQTETGYRKAFRDAYFTRHNGEMLLSVRRAYRNTYSNYFCGGADNYAQNQCPTLAYANLFQVKEGNEWKDFPADFDWENPTVDPFANRDPRFYETILTNNRPYKNRQSQLYVGGLDRLTEDKDGTGLLMYKFSQDYTAATSIGAIDCWPAMRLAEVFLSYAEAINEVNGGPNDIAYSYVNKVRNRVGLSDLPKDMTQGEFRAAVLRERACEFGYEEVHWYDIIRWKNEEAFKAEIQGVNMYINKSNPTGFTYKVFTVTPERTWKTNWSPKWYLSAFPVKEVDKNYGLVQNPGW